MSGIQDLIAQIEVELEACQKRAAKTLKERELIITTAQRDGRSNLTDEEDERISQLREQHDAEKENEKGIRAKLATTQEIAEEEAKREKAQKETTRTEARKPAYDGVARVGTEERTYRPDADRRGAAFVRDVARQFLYQDPEAGHRLSRHMAEERVERAQYLTRAAGTGAFTGLVVPQYLTDMYAPAVAALRPFADICNKHDLPPDGMSVNISRITTATSVALQATENTAVSETNADDTLLTENVQTAAGQQTLSRQAIDRGSGVEEVVMDDLFRRYATTLDSTLINQATTGLAAVATSTAFTTASPAFVSSTAADSLYGKILGAASGVEAALLSQGVPTHAIMHSRRWNWAASKVAAVWPSISQPNIPTQAGGVNLATGYNAGLRGVLPNGLGVVVDNNISTALGTATNEDEIYIVPANECHLWEDPQAPVFIRAEQAAAASLGVLLVLYGYFAYSFRRYANGMGKVGGTGLTTPSF